MAETKGGCACGAVRWVHEGAFIRHLVCHCETCRRAVSAGCSAFVGTREADVIWTGEFARFESSPEAERGFCGACGTQLFFKSTRWPGELHLHVGTLDDPGRYVPDKHVVLAERVAWLPLADDIARDEGFHLKPGGPRDG